MPNPIGMFFGGIGAVGGAGLSMATSGTAGRMAIGATGGAIAGAASGYDATSRLEGAGKGALLGMMGGAIPSIVPSAAKWGVAAAPDVARVGFGVGKAAIRAGKLALDNPVATMALAGGAIGAASGATSWREHKGSIQSTESPGMSGARMNMSFNQQAMMTQELGQIGGGQLGSADMMQEQFGYAKMMSNAGMYMASKTKMGRFAESTVGLPQGLHQGRHG